MPTYFQRPENALKRAKEFIEVGKKQRALDALYDVIKSKRHRTWQKIHEPIMELYLELCVELKKSHIAKEGLYQYKNICQQVNIKSLEDIVKRYLSLAEEKTEEARKESHQSVVDVDDLDVLQTPENLLMSAVSGEDTQDRTDRAILTPWLKFLWESYRQCLDLLRNNSLLEKLYQEVAQNALKFCQKYSRKTEFRKLGDILHTHLEHVMKHQNQQRAINLNNAESQTMHLETRLVLLDSAIQIELWQEAYKAIEDIHRLIVLSKKQPRPSLMANYYQKLGLVFYKSGNFMFHCCAWHRLFHLYREQRKNLSEHELQKLSSRVVCASLAIPLTALRNQADHILEQDDSVRDKQKRLATLLGLSNPPTRQSLVRDLVKYGIIQHVYPELANLYQWLEVEFNPLQLCNNVTVYLDFIREKDELKQYSAALEEVTIMRLIKQVSQIYQTISFDRLSEMVPFANSFRLERVIVDAAKSLDLQVRINHGTRSLNFGTALGVGDAFREGPEIQTMPSEQIRNQLILMCHALEKCNGVISSREIQTARDSLRVQILQTYRQTAKKDHMYMQRRRQIIEERKEELENQTVQREKEEQELAEEQKRKQMEAEYARLEREAEEREKQKRLEEHRDIQKKVAKERLEQLKSTSVGAKAFADLSEDALANMDVDEIMSKQVEHLEKEKREKEEKLKAQEKKIDYFERAKCLEEIPLIQAQYESEKLVMKQFWEETEAERIAELQKERDVSIAQRNRLDRMRGDRDEFIAKLKKERMSVYKEKLSEFEKKLTEERKKRLMERKEKRKEERRLKWIAAKEEEAQRKRDEELKRQKEEEERIAREKQEQKDAEYNERIRKLEEIEEKKRQREREIEEKRLKEKEESLRSKEREEDTSNVKRSDDSWRRDGPARDRDGPTSSWAQPKDGGWRSREKAKDESWKKTAAEDDVKEDNSWRRRVDEDDRRGPIRDDERRPPARGDDDRRGPVRDDDRRGPMRDEDRRGPMRNDDRRGPAQDEDSSRWRDRANARDDWHRDDDLRDDRSRWGPSSRGDRDQDRRRREDSPPKRDDFDGPWRRGAPAREDRDERGQDSWRKGPSNDERLWRENRDRKRDFDSERSGRDFDQDRDRGSRNAPPRELRDRDNRGPPPARGNDRDWRRDDRGPARDDRGPARDDRALPRDDWRSKDSRGPPARPKDVDDNEVRGRPRADTEEDGWQTVRH